MFKQTKYLIAALVLLGTSLFYSCSKERIEEEEKNDYESMNDYYDSKKEEEQDFVIDTGGTCPVQGKHGTRVCPGITSIETGDGGDVEFPFNMHLIELYSPKDIIYYQLSDSKGSGYIGDNGIISLRATKGGESLKMKTSGAWSLEMPSTLPSADQEAFYSSSGSSWSSASPIENFTTTAYGYDGFSTDLSWLANGEDYGTSNTSARFTFSSEVDNLDNVVTYIYLPNKSSIIRVDNQSSISLPSGESVKIILMAINGSGDLYHYFEETTVGTTDKNIDLELSKISDDDLTTILDEL